MDSNYFGEPPILKKANYLGKPPIALKKANCFGEPPIALKKLFVKSQLIPAIIQDADSKRVLMLGYMNEESLNKTLETGTVWFWSRSRGRLWNKGETSGNFLNVVEIFADCDDDTLLIMCKPKGPTCHTGSESCFFKRLGGFSL